jgi:hypothetical protein
VFERFTDQARRCIVLAQEEARLLNHGYIGSEHALLGVAGEGQGLGARALHSLDVSVETVRAKVVALVGRGDRPAAGHIPFTPQAKRALEGALREALHVGDHEIGTEHLLLGLIRDGESTAARTLVELGLDLDDVRQAVSKLREGGGEEVRATAEGEGLAAPFAGRTGACSFCGRDLWEVPRCVTGAYAVICETCVASARDALERAPAKSRTVPLPPRVFGDVPDPDAVEAVVAAVRTAFGGETPDEERIGAIEEGGSLLTMYAAAASSLFGGEARIDRMRFDAHGAEVRFTVAAGVVLGPTYAGRVVRAGDGWRVSRDLFVAVMRGAGARGVTSRRLEGRRQS